MNQEKQKTHTIRKSHNPNEFFVNETEKVSMMDLNQFRKSLGKYGLNKSDEELQQQRDIMYRLGHCLYESWNKTLTI